jgi:hypothetical protein
MYFITLLLASRLLGIKARSAFFILKVQASVTVILNEKINYF